MAYQIEMKTRMFINEILKYTCARFHSNGQRWVYFDMEVEMRLFQEVIRPDYQMMRKAQKPDEPYDTPLYVIEVKRTDYRARNIKEHLNQHFKQLRHICIQNGLSQIYGVHTNYREWFFTRYDLQQEVQAELKLAERSSKGATFNESNPYAMTEEIIYEVSDSFELLDSRDNSLRIPVLKQITQILEWLIT